jgi:hypothetical protein
MRLMFGYVTGGESRGAIGGLLGLLLGLALAPPGLALDRVERLVSEGERRSSEGEEAQQRIDRVSEETERLLDAYRQATKVLDGLQVYNELLGRQVDGQRDEIVALQDSIDRVALIERQIVPLMVRMIDSLDAFIALDVPFLPEERGARAARLRALLTDSGVSVAEKFRKVLEAYQVENDYGRTIEAYRDMLDIDGQPREVDLLRVGRVGLYYLTPDGSRAGAWDPGAGAWTALDITRYRATLANGLRIARKQAAPDLLVLPMPAPATGGAP